MTNIQEFEAELKKKLYESYDATLIRWVSEKVLESYKNGITAAEKGAKVIRLNGSPSYIFDCSCARMRR